MSDPLVVRLDPVAPEPTELAELARLGESLRLEVGVDYVPVTAESEAQAWRSPPPPGMRRILAVARRDATVVGRGDAIFVDRDHEHLGEIGTLYVLPEFRGAGVGSRLLAEVLDGAHPDTLLVATTVDRLPGGAFAASLGATVGIRHHRYRLDVARIDWDRYRRWAHQGAGPDYELLRWHGACPDELLERYVALSEVMNSVPQGDLARPPILTLSMEEFRRREARRAAAGIEAWTVAARHRPTSVLAGLHDLTLPVGASVATVQNTGVAEAHRGHSIGRWLKAAMALWITDQRPAITRFLTATSDVNHHMRRVNEALGYELELERTVWQARLGTVRERLRARGR